jgi:hypothetical protein
MSKQKDKDIPTLCLYLSDQLYAKFRLYAKWKLLNWRNNETFCSTLCQLSANMTYEMPWVNKNNKICPKLTNLNHSAAVLLSIIEASELDHLIISSDHSVPTFCTYLISNLLIFILLGLRILKSLVTRFHTTILFPLSAIIWFPRGWYLLFYVCEYLNNAMIAEFPNRWYIYIYICKVFCKIQIICKMKTA